MVKKIVLLGFLIVAFASCSLGSSYNFIDQVLQGQINGVAWTYDPAASHASVYGSDISFDLHNTGATTDLMFTVPASVGLTELKVNIFDPFSPDNHTATLYDGTNYICSDGAIEITAIDTTARTVSGRVDARFDDSTFANGSFSFTY